MGHTATLVGKRIYIYGGGMLFCPVIPDCVFGLVDASLSNFGCCNKAHAPRVVVQARTTQATRCIRMCLFSTLRSTSGPSPWCCFVMLFGFVLFVSVFFVVCV